MDIEALEGVASSWTTCRECGRACDGPLGLHRHVRSAHKMSAWEYYQRHPWSLLLRALDGSDLVWTNDDDPRPPNEDRPDKHKVSAVAGPCWIHRGKPARWGARLRVAGAPTFILYRLTFWVVNGVFPPQYGCHVCDDPQCCSPLHVWNGTPKQNAHDRNSKGRGYDRRLLEADQVRELRRLRHTGATYRELGTIFGVGEETARRAVVGSTYAEVDDGETAREMDAVADALGDEIPW